MNYHLIGLGKWSKTLIEYLPRFMVESDYDNATWVIVTASTTSHYDIVKKALEDKKNVFCEKPLTINPLAAHELYLIAENECVYLFSNNSFAYTFNQSSSDFNYFKRSKKKSNYSYLESYSYHHLAKLIFTDNSYSDYLIEKKGNRIFSLFNMNKRVYFDYSDTEKDIHLINNEPVVNDNLRIKRFYQDLFSNPSIYYFKDKNLTILTISLMSRIRKILYPSVGIVGAGIFGLVSAIKLSESGFNVYVYEGNSDAMVGASGSNQYRIHRGYHYPRSQETVDNLSESYFKFEKYFSEAIEKDDSISHYYSIAKNGSKTNREKYIEFMNRNALNYTEVDAFSDNLEATFKVDEKLFDPIKLKRILLDRCRASDVTIHYNSIIDDVNEIPEEIKVVAVYSSLNDLVKTGREIKLEIVEKPLVKLPVSFKNISHVVMDGDYFCFDPLLGSDYHLLGNVSEAILFTTYNSIKLAKLDYLSTINVGLSKSSFTKIRKFMSDINEYFPIGDDYKYIGSYFTIRAVLANSEYDDARPTIVERLDDNVWYLFSGKIPTCIDAADELAYKINSSIIYTK